MASHIWQTNGMMTFNQFLKRLQPLERSQVHALAEKSGVSAHTLEKVWRGATKNPGILLVEPVAKQLEKVPQ